MSNSRKNRGDRNRFFTKSTVQQPVQTQYVEYVPVENDNATFVRNFHQEYLDSLQLGSNAAGDIFLVDILQ